jgi:hypothetical protein
VRGDLYILFLSHRLAHNDDDELPLFFAVEKEQKPPKKWTAPGRPDWAKFRHLGDILAERE